MYYKPTPDIDKVSLDDAQSRIWEDNENEAEGFDLDVEIDDDTIERLMTEQWFDEFEGEVIATRDESDNWIFQLRKRS